MKVYDITKEITEDMVVYKNNKKKKPRISCSTKNGVRESKFHIESHTGTHIDAPSHMIKGKFVSEINPEKFISDCQVFDLTDLDEKITEANLKKLNIVKDFLLFKTKNSYDMLFNFNFIYLDKSAAKYLIKKKVKGVGIDSLGIERNQPNHDTHKILLKNEIIILEGLDLKKIKPGIYKLFFAPLKIRADAAPVRALLIG